MWRIKIRNRISIRCRLMLGGVRSRVTSDGGLLLARELDERLGLRWNSVQATHRRQTGCRMLGVFAVKKEIRVKSFQPLCAPIPHDLRVTRAIIDGEIACMDKHGRTKFNDLLFRRGDRCFVAFDLLYDGADLRPLPLYERKSRLRSVVRDGGRILYANHIEERGEELFALACELVLEGIVAKHKFSPYICDGQETSWVKIKNRKYSQTARRDELFERMADRNRQWAATDGWSGCTLVYAEAVS